MKLIIHTQQGTTTKALSEAVQGVLKGIEGNVRGNAKTRSQRLKMRQGMVVEVFL